MTNTLNFIGVYFGLIAIAALASGHPATLPAVMSGLFLTNTPLSKHIERPENWHMTFLGLNLAMMLYSMTFNTLAMNIAAFVFMSAALLNLFIMMRIQWADRLHDHVGMVMILAITFAVTAHIALETAK